VQQERLVGNSAQPPEGGQSGQQAPGSDSHATDAAWAPEPALPCEILAMDAPGQAKGGGQAPQQAENDLNTSEQRGPTALDVDTPVQHGQGTASEDNSGHAMAAADALDVVPSENSDPAVDNAASQLAETNQVAAVDDVHPRVEAATNAAVEDVGQRVEANKPELDAVVEDVSRQMAEAMRLHDAQMDAMLSATGEKAADHEATGLAAAPAAARQEVQEQPLIAMAEEELEQRLQSVKEALRSLGGNCSIQALYEQLEQGALLSQVQVDAAIAKGVVRRELLKGRAKIWLVIPKAKPVSYKASDPAAKQQRKKRKAASAEKASQKKPDSSPMFKPDGWNCDACGFVNSTHRSSCTKCGHKEVQTPHSASRKPKKSGAADDHVPWPTLEALQADKGLRLFLSRYGLEVMSSESDRRTVVALTASPPRQNPEAGTLDYQVGEALGIAYWSNKRCWSVAYALGPRPPAVGSVRFGWVPNEHMETTSHWSDIAVQQRKQGSKLKVSMSALAPARAATAGVFAANLKQHVKKGAHKRKVQEPEEYDDNDDDNADGNDLPPDPALQPEFPDHDPNNNTNGEKNDSDGDDDDDAEWPGLRDALGESLRDVTGRVEVDTSASSAAGTVLDPVDDEKGLQEAEPSAVLDLEGLQRDPTIDEGGLNDSGDDDDNEEEQDAVDEWPLMEEAIRQSLLSHDGGGESDVDGAEHMDDDVLALLLSGDPAVGGSADTPSAPQQAAGSGADPSADSFEAMPLQPVLADVRGRVEQQFAPHSTLGTGVPPSVTSIDAYQGATELRTPPEASSVSSANKEESLGKGGTPLAAKDSDRERKVEGDAAGAITPARAVHLSAPAAATGDAVEATDLSNAWLALDGTAMKQQPPSTSKPSSQRHAVTLKRPRVAKEVAAGGQPLETRRQLAAHLSTLRSSDLSGPASSPRGTADAIAFEVETSSSAKKLKRPSPPKGNGAEEVEAADGSNAEELQAASKRRLLAAMIEGEEEGAASAQSEVGENPSGLVEGQALVAVDGAAASAPAPSSSSPEKMPSDADVPSSPVWGAWADNALLKELERVYVEESEDGRFGDCAAVRSPLSGHATEKAYFSWRFRHRSGSFCDGSVLFFFFCSFSSVLFSSSFLFLSFFLSFFHNARHPLCRIALAHRVPRRADWLFLGTSVQSLCGVAASAAAAVP
jgi:hypothetical protein